MAAGQIWRQFLFWCGQLFAVGGAAQVLTWLLGADEVVTQWLREHVPSTLFALVLYFAAFPLYVLLTSAERGSRQRFSELREDDDV